MKDNIAHYEKGPNLDGGGRADLSEKVYLKLKPLGQRRKERSRQKTQLVRML